MKKEKKEFSRENIEAEGYTLRVEEGITYIEKEEKKNNSKYGECLSFFQQKIELDKEGKEIVTQTNRLYKKSENKKQNLESTELIFEGKILTRELNINEEFENCTYYDENKNIIKTIKKELKDNMQYTNEYQQVNGKSVLIKTMNGRINEESTFIAEYNSEGMATYLSSIKGDKKKSITYHDNGNAKLISIKQINGEEIFITENNLKGIKIYLSYIEGDIKKSIYRNEDGLLIKEIEENKESGIKKTTNYDKFGSINIVYEEDAKTGKNTSIYYYYDDEYNKNLDFKKITVTDKEGKIVEEKYSKTRNGIIEEYIDNQENNIISGESNHITLRKIENLENGAKKITEGNKIIYQYENEKITDTYRSIAEDNIDTISQKIIERNGEKIVIQFNIQEYFTSALRTIQISNISIEESYKKGDFLPTFKVDGFEIPLDSVDKYKDICKKYDIESIFKVLGKTEPKETIQSKIKSFIDVFKR